MSLPRFFRALWRRMPPRVRRLECRWRKRHTATRWEHGYSICDRCGEKRRTPAPPETLVTDEAASHLYRKQADGSLRRLDKVKGGKKARRRQPAKVAEVRAVQKALRESQGGD